MDFKVCVILIVVFSNSNVFAARKLSARRSRDCSIDVRNKAVNKFSPLWFNNYTSYFIDPIPEEGVSHFSLLKPKEGVFKLKHGQMITIACPDNKNYITTTNSNSTYAACDGGETFKVGAINVQFDDLKCKKIIQGGIQKSNKTCGNNKGHFIYIGYQITKIHWFTLITVCYDEKTGNTLYAEHILHGESIQYATRGAHRPTFSTEGLGSSIAASIAYKQTFQKSSFNKLLGSAETAARYIHENSYFARGHLSPAADFLCTASQSTTYYYINTCPQWQVINAGNWKSVEMAVRRTAKVYKDTFSVITGTHGILSLNDVNNTQKEIFLGCKGKLPVPKYVWKLVYDHDIRVGIAFVVLNNPFVKEVSQRDLLCQSVCEYYDWGSNSWSDVKHGHVHCCNLDNFAKVVKTAPVFQVDGVLRGF